MACRMRGELGEECCCCDCVARIMPEDSIFNDLGDSANFKKASIVKVLAYPCNKVRDATETAFYVANTPLTAPRAAAAVRVHWRIETTSHYSRDVTFGEDRSRISSNPGVFARLRSFAFNILKANRAGTLSQDRYRAALAGVDNLLRLLIIP
jgi:predicted transposase YbfD/YdcC